MADRKVTVEERIFHEKGAAKCVIFVENGKIDSIKLFYKGGEDRRAVEGFEPGFFARIGSYFYKDDGNIQELRNLRDVIDAAISEYDTLPK